MTTYAAPGETRLVLAGEKVPQQLTYVDAAFDATAMQRLFAGVIQVNAGSSLNLIGCGLANAPRDLIVSFGDRLSLDRCTVGAFGMGARAGDHLEAIFVHRGHFEFSRSTLDPSAGAAAVVPNTMTASLFLKADYGPILAVIEGSRIVGSKALGLLYPIQVGSKYPLTLIVGNTALERGKSGYIGRTELAPGVLRVIDLGGNTDADTGAAIDLTWPKS